MASKRRREVMGARLRGEVRKATALMSSVESKTLRRPGMSAPPKLGSMKKFCAICQLAHSRGWAGHLLCRGRHLDRLWRRACGFLGRR